MSKFFETENVSTWEGLEPSIFGFMPNALTIWAIWARHLLPHVLNTDSGSVDKMHIGISTTKYFPWARSLVVLVWLVTYLQSKPSSNYWIAAELFKSALLSIYSSSNRTYFTRKKQQDGVYHTFSCPNLSFIRNERSNSSSVMYWQFSIAHRVACDKLRNGSLKISRYMSIYVDVIEMFNSQQINPEAVDIELSSPGIFIVVIESNTFRLTFFQQLWACTLKKLRFSNTRKLLHVAIS